MSEVKKPRFVAVDMDALVQVLRALNGPGYYIAELQATRGLDKLPGQPRNPINLLAEQIEAQLQHLPQEAPVTQTTRGFDRVDFKDFYGRDCSLQESSMAATRGVWLGVEPDQVTRDMRTPDDQPRSRMHLTQPEVANLLPYLLKFVAVGDI